ncbi:MAG: rhombosortase [Alphaproteobacteria bacterium]
MLCNLHLFTNTFPENTALFPENLFAGEWWRVFTHYFAHLSWYHLLIDVGAFLFLFFSIKKKTRYLYFAACAVGSLVTPLIFSEIIYSNGLCGLSGIAHGLMVVAALEMTKTKQTKIIGFVAFSIVILKTTIELTFSPSTLSFLHVGDVGIPIAECHLGGIIGGITIFIVINWQKTVKFYINLKNDIINRKSIKIL